MSKKKKLKFGLPKGSLQDATVEKLAKAGWNVQVSSRSYIPYVDDDELEIRTIRAQEMSIYVERGYLDCGITGRDWIDENNSKVHEVGEFLFSKATRRHFTIGTLQPVVKYCRGHLLKIFRHNMISPIN